MLLLLSLSTQAETVSIQFGMVELRLVFSSGGLHRIVDCANPALLRASGSNIKLLLVSS